MWQSLHDFLEHALVVAGTVDAIDLQLITLAETAEEAIKVILEHAARVE